MTLAEKGVRYKGFGVLPKYVMCNPTLTPEAKATFALLRSYAGNSDNAYPGIDLITDQLGISINRFYHHFKQLLEKGYVTKKQHRQKGQKYANNIYTFTKQPEGTVKGYGLIPKAVMTDDSLDIMSKAIYAYMCCYKDAHTNVALINKKLLLYHLGMVESTYYRYFRPLVVMGYITVEKKARNGHFAENVYILNEIPEMSKGESTPPVNEYTANEFAALVNTVVADTNKTPRNITVSNTTLPNINLSEKLETNTHTSVFANTPIDSNTNEKDFLEKKTLFKKQAKLFIENDKYSNLTPELINTPDNANLNAARQANATFIPYNVWGEVSDDEMADIRRELADNNGNLRCFIDDNRKMSAAIHLLFESCDTGDSGVFRLIVSCTAQLACHSDNKPLKVGAGYYERDTIIDKLNEFISPSLDASLSFAWAHSFISYYSDAVKKYNIKNINAYTKASILHYLYVDFPMFKDTSIPLVEEECQSSFDINLFWQKSLESSMSPDDDYDLNVI